MSRSQFSFFLHSSCSSLDIFMCVYIVVMCHIHINMIVYNITIFILHKYNYIYPPYTCLYSVSWRQVQQSCTLSIVRFYRL